ncbi:MAG TPA: hypothetical protein VFH91_08770 [Pyrinomonadaceae bacterium]|nr:hypothetical protein [Pyrinomonadaceae bacterium]
MGIVVFLITSAVQFLVAVFGFFILLLALNGYSEQSATPGIVIYTLVSLIIVLGLASIAAFVSTRIVSRKGLGSLAVGSLSTIGFSILGGVFLVGTFFVSVGIAELLRTLK